LRYLALVRHYIEREDSGKTPSVIKQLFLGAPRVDLRGILIIVVRYADVYQLASLNLLERLEYVCLHRPSPLLYMLPLPFYQLAPLVNPVKLLLCLGLLADEVVFRALLGTHQSLYGQRFLCFQGSPLLVLHHPCLAGSHSVLKFSCALVLLLGEAIWSGYRRFFENFHNFGRVRGFLNFD
jgi:hypothetical protein